MKKTDIAMIALIAVASVMIAFFVTRSILGDQSTETVKVKTMTKIQATVEKPDPNIFNADAINPAVEVEINGAGR
jgi:ABC-type maltose transport system permease subunit